MTLQRLFSLAVAFPLLLAVAVAEEPDDARFGAEGEQRILELTRFLEENPLADNAREVRAEVLEWWVEAPHLTLNWCAGMLLDGKNKAVSPLVVTQGLFGAGAYLIRHKDQAEDELRISRAGVESALTAYRNAAAVGKKYADKFYESLLDRQEAGTLDGYVEGKLRECREAEGE